MRTRSMVVLLLIAGCGDAEAPGSRGEVASVSSAVSTAPSPACKGLLEAQDNVCPDKPSCAVITAEIAKHGCVPPAVCPCSSGYYVYRSFNGLYCAATINSQPGRLSICLHGGQEVCVLNYGGSSPMQVAPEVCAACRSQFPVTAYNVETGGTETITACSDI